MLYCEDPEWPSVTLPIGARALLLCVPKGISSSGWTSLDPSASPCRAGAPDPKQSEDPLLKLPQFIDVFLVSEGNKAGYDILDVFWRALSRDGMVPSLCLLALLLVTQLRRLLATFAAKACCWLMFNLLYTKIVSTALLSSQAPACVVYSFPGAGWSICPCWISGDSCWFCLNTGARYAFLHFLGTSPAPQDLSKVTEWHYKGVSHCCEQPWTSSSVPWAPVGQVILKSLTQS